MYETMLVSSLRNSSDGTKTLDTSREPSVGGSTTTESTRKTRFPLRSRKGRVEGIEEVEEESWVENEAGQEEKLDGM